MQSAASDLPLIEAAAREAGALIRDAFGGAHDVSWKDNDSPVTAVDLAVDALLTDRLRTARPDYGWLSEETADNDARLVRSRVFIVDPIDGTRAFIAGRPEFCVSIGVSVHGRAALGCVYNPITEEMYLGGVDVPATCNGKPIAPTKRAELEYARLIGKRELYNNPRWPRPWPPLDLGWVNSIAYRMAKIASGAFDGAFMPGFKNEWDTAGGVAILEAAGGRASDMRGADLVYNLPDPRAAGCVATGGGPLHALLIERVEHLPHPREWEAAAAAARKEAKP